MLKVLSLALAFVLSSAGISDCSSGTSIFKISELSQSPETSIVPGQNLSLHLLYTVPQPIKSGTAVTTISLNGLPLSPTTEDLCAKVSCPIEVGEHNGDSWSIFPSGVTGKIDTKIEWKDQYGNELLCLKSTLKASSALRGKHDLSD